MSRRAWIVPSLYATGALAAGVFLPRLESRLFPTLTAGMSVPAAMAIYSSIASGMIALTGIVFSLAFVAVQFSATAYSPRLVVWVARSPLIAHALGVFTATFFYAIAALAWLDRGQATVPMLSAFTVIGLLLASVVLLIALIERIAGLSVSRMLTFIADQGRHVIETIYPDPYAPPAEADAPAGEAWRAAPVQTVLYRGRATVVQRVDVPALIELGRRLGGVVELSRAVGDTVIDASPLLTVSDGLASVDEPALRRAVVFGEERTFDQDPKYPIRLLVDIAIRALSPAVNDPTTAVQVLDQIGDLLERLAWRRLENGVYRDRHGALRLVVPVPAWEDFILLSFDEIRTYGATSLQVMRRMTALVADLIAAVPKERRPALESWQARLQRTIARSFSDPEDQLEASVGDRQGFGVPRRQSAA